MAAPVPSTRIAPAGKLLKDGYRSLVTLAIDTNIELFEIGVTGPGIDGGDAINTTTMWNNEWRTMRSRALKTLTESTFTFAYDPIIYVSVVAACNVETTITETFNDNSKIAYYGYLQSVEFDERVEGTMPTGTATIQPTNFDPVNKVEAGPVEVDVPGT